MCTECGQSGHLKTNCPKVCPPSLVGSSDKDGHSDPESINLLENENSDDLEEICVEDEVKIVDIDILPNCRIISKRKHCEVNASDSNNDDIEIRGKKTRKDRKLKYHSGEGLIENEGSSKKCHTHTQDTSIKNTSLNHRTKYNLVFVHIETLKSSIYRETHLTQIGCCSALSRSSAQFFRAIKPVVLDKYLDYYKLSGDLMRALHMTREEDGSCLFRTQFEIVKDPERLFCVTEMEALENLVDFLRQFHNCVLVAVDEDAIALLAMKVKKYLSIGFEDVVVGFTCWKNLVQNIPGCQDLELEEFYRNNVMKKDLTEFVSAKDISFFLRLSVEVVIEKWKDFGKDSNVEYIFDQFVSDKCKRIECLPEPNVNLCKPQNSEENIEVFNSFRPSVSTTLIAQKLEQINVNSGSESEENENTSRRIKKDPEPLIFFQEWEISFNKQSKEKYKVRCPSCINPPDMNICNLKFHLSKVHKFRTEKLISPCGVCKEHVSAGDLLAHVIQEHQITQIQPSKSEKKLPLQVSNYSCEVKSPSVLILKKQLAAILASESSTPPLTTNDRCLEWLEASYTNTYTCVDPLDCGSMYVHYREYCLAEGVDTVAPWQFLGLVKKISFNPDDEGELSLSRIDNIMNKNLKGILIRGMLELDKIQHKVSPFLATSRNPRPNNVTQQLEHLGPPPLVSKHCNPHQDIPWFDNHDVRLPNLPYTPIYRPHRNQHPYWRQFGRR